MDNFRNRDENEVDRNKTNLGYGGDTMNEDINDGDVPGGRTRQQSQSDSSLNNHQQAGGAQNNTKRSPSQIG